MANTHPPCAGFGFFLPSWLPAENPAGLETRLYNLAEGFKLQA
jgi:hypothetical protein